MVSSSKLAKTTGWLIILGPLVDIIMTLIKPGNFVSDHPDGATTAMLESVQDVAANSGAAHLSVELGLFASFAFLLGCYGVERLLRDGSWDEYLRKAGLLFIMAAYTLRAVSYAMGHLLANVLTHGMEGVGSMATTDAAILVAGIEGTLGLFATIMVAVGVALYGVSLMNASLIGADKVLAVVLAILPAIGVGVMLFIGSHSHENVLGAYLVGNLLALVQVVWTILLGAAFIRKSDSLAVA